MTTILKELKIAQLCTKNEWTLAIKLERQKKIAAIENKKMACPFIRDPRVYFLDTCFGKFI